MTDKEIPEYVKDFERCLDVTGVMLNPGNPDKCLGNGEVKGIDCRCDECDFYLKCFPEWDKDETKG